VTFTEYHGEFGGVKDRGENQHRRRLAHSNVAQVAMLERGSRMVGLGTTESAAPCFVIFEAWASLLKLSRDFPKEPETLEFSPTCGAFQE
jgi:hypothetical protein